MTDHQIPDEVVAELADVPKEAADAVRAFIQRVQRRNRWLMACAGVVVVASVFGSTIAIATNVAVDDVREAVNVGRVATARVLATNARADCKTEYNSLRNTAIEYRNSVAIAAQQDIIGYLLGLVPAERLAANRQALTDANRAVEQFPTLAVMAEQGWIDMAGVTHPRCPTVK